MIRRLLLGLLSATAGGACVSAADWPQWRGPARDGKSADTGLLMAWPEGGPKLMWKIDTAGAGYGQPAVVGDKVYLIGSSTGKMGGVDSVQCLSSKDGSKVWSVEIDTAKGQYADNWGGGPRATPTIDGEFLYALGETGDLVCLKTADGAKVWSKNLVKDFGGDIPQWGYAESVLVSGDHVVVTPGGKKPGRGENISATQKPDFQGAIVALDKKTGKTVWVCKELKDPAGYSSVMPVEVGGVKTYVQQTYTASIGVRASDGKLLWRNKELPRATAVIPTPVIDGSLAFFTSGYSAGCELVEMKADGQGGVDGKIAYTKNKSLSNHTGGAIVIEGHVYGHSDQGGWTCLNLKDGKAAWQTQKFPKGSITFADGMGYCYAETTGEIARIQPNATEWKEVDRFKLPGKSPTRPNSGKFWPHPVVANGILFIRDYELLYAYNVKAAAE